MATHAFRRIFKGNQMSHWTAADPVTLTPRISSRIMDLAAALLLTACAAGPAAAGNGVLEVQVDASASGRGGNTPAFLPAPSGAPRRAGWRLEVLRPDGSGVASMTTDDHGMAYVTLPPGNYLLRQAAPPGMEAAQAVSVTAGSTTHTLLHLHDPIP
jgi:hypothetical protein